MSTFGAFSVVRSTVKRVQNSSGVLASVAVNTPAFEFNANGSYRGTSIEPAATNLALRSEEFDNAYWTKNNATVTANSGVAPDGTTTMDTIVSTSANGGVSRSGFSFTAGTTYTLSFYVQNIDLLSGEIINVTISNGVDSERRIGFAIFNGTSTTGGSGANMPLAGSNVELLPNGVYRVSISATSTNISAVGIISIRSATSGRSFRAWGAQFEEGTLPTSYIPTVASTVARGADNVRLTGASSLIGQTEGTMYLEWENQNNGLCNLVETYNQASAITGTSSILLQKSSNNQLNIRVFDSLSNYADTFTVTMPIGKNKVALAYESGSAVLYLNGVSVGSNSRTYVFVGSRDLINFDPRGAYPRASLALFLNKLSNAQLASLTTL